jgi:hypothetical protein
VPILPGMVVLPDLAIPRPNKTDACTYDIQLLGTSKYDRMGIQSKVFDGANCIPALYRLFNNCANITRSGFKPDLVIPRPNRKGDCTYSIFT